MWSERDPLLVVVPFRSHAYALKKTLFERLIPLLGVRFISPAELRALLLQREDFHLPLREHLRLLLSVAAEVSMDLPADPGAREQRLLEPDFLAAKAVSRTPDHLLRALDQIRAAGWSFDDAGPASLRRVVRRFDEYVADCGFSMIHEADRFALDRASASPPRFARILVTGFDSSHWALWPLLRAGVCAAREATVILEDPRDESRDLDEAWVGTWEQAFGPARPLGASEKSSAVPEQGSFLFETPAPPANVHFLVGKDTTEQADAIVAIAATFLTDQKCERVGIVFPRAGALARSVASAFTRLGIAYNDGIAHVAPGPFEEPSWKAWLELQENLQLGVLLRFLRALPDGAALFDRVDFSAVEKILSRAYGNVLIDDLGVIAESCRRSPREDWKAVARGIDKLRFLPATASLREFLDATRITFEQFGWDERGMEVVRLSEGWSDALEQRFSRRIYLRWLGEISSSLHPLRDRGGDHPYSRVHLLFYNQAAGREWSHLILAGLNDGEWPPAGDESGFLSEGEIAAFNTRVKVLNKRAIRVGNQGEGHWSVVDGKTLFLGPHEQRQLASRQLASLLESTREAIAITANLFQQAAPERTWNPSEYFTRLYFDQRGKALSQGVMSALQRQTRAWLDDAVLRTASEALSVQQASVAYAARRRSDIPAGEYDFALREPIARPVTVSVTEWQKTLSEPAIVWMRNYLGVEVADELNDGWSAATGQWTHKWLAGISGKPAANEFSALPDPDEIRDRVSSLARNFRDEVKSLCAAAGRPLPDWWISGWDNAFYLAGCLAAKFAEIGGWPQIATEWVLDSASSISLGSGERLRARGRIDAILTDAAQLEGASAWIIDFKTGNKKALSSSRWKNPVERREGVRKKLLCGDGVQLGLYALALQDRGAKSVALSILSPALRQIEPQLDLSDLVTHDDFWCALHSMQETGVFGMLGPIRSDYSFTGAYPIATLAIDPDVLADKWLLTHPALCADCSEEAS